MQRMRRSARAATRNLVWLCIACLCGGAGTCTKGESSLRGRSLPSVDGKTYLVVDDDNGGEACKTMKVDGKPWRHPLHHKGEIAPGVHTIRCGGDVRFKVKPGTTFHFDYWGP